MAIDTEHRRVAKLRKQELNVLGTKFGKEYGILVEEICKMTNQPVTDVSNAIHRFGTSILNDDRKREEMR